MKGFCKSGSYQLKHLWGWPWGLDLTYGEWDCLGCIAQHWISLWNIISKVQRIYLQSYSPSSNVAVCKNFLHCEDFKKMFFFISNERMFVLMKWYLKELLHKMIIHVSKTRSYHQFTSSEPVGEILYQADTKFNQFVKLTTWAYSGI